MYRLSVNYAYVDSQSLLLVEVSKNLSKDRHHLLKSRQLQGFADENSMFGAMMYTTYVGVAEANTVVTLSRVYEIGRREIPARGHQDTCLGNLLPKLDFEGLLVTFFEGSL